MDSSRPRAVAGAIAVALNIVAVVALREIPSAYRIARLDEWAAAVAQHPTATAISAGAFTLGLIALAIWALELGRDAGGSLARVGGLAVAFGALLNAAGTVTPLVAAYHIDATTSVAVTRALLGITISLDAAFNAALGVGLLCLAAAWPQIRNRWLGYLGGIAGLASLPVSAQAVYDPAASLLAIAGPLWLLFVSADAFTAWGSKA